MERNTIQYNTITSPIYDPSQLKISLFRRDNETSIAISPKWDGKYLYLNKDVGDFIVEAPTPNLFNGSLNESRDIESFRTVEGTNITSFF